MNQKALQRLAEAVGGKIKKDNSIFIEFTLSNYKDFSIESIEAAIFQSAAEYITEILQHRNFKYIVDGTSYLINSIISNIASDDEPTDVIINTNIKNCIDASLTDEIQNSDYYGLKRKDVATLLKQRNIEFSSKLTLNELIQILILDDKNKEIQIDENKDKIIKSLEQQNAELTNALDIEKQKKQEVVEKIVEKIIYRDIADKDTLDPVIDAIEKLKNYNSVFDNREEFIDENGEVNYKVQLAEYGKNNTQIFTREQDIKSMINSIGNDIILNPATTILEPTSGDGAFTIRILSYRLTKICNECFELKDFLYQSLVALSTIYSIEYEADTAFVQRCNLYTTMRIYYEKFLKKLNIETTDYNNEWETLVKKIIFDNIIWGAFAATNHPEYKNYDKVLGFDRSTGRPLCIIKWSFSIDKKLKIKYKKEVIS